MVGEELQHFYDAMKAEAQSILAFWEKYAPDPSDKQLANRIDGWTCPYHNTRMCLELIQRLEGMQDNGNK